MRDKVSPAGSSTDLKDYNELLLRSGSNSPVELSEDILAFEEYNKELERLWKDDSEEEKDFEVNLRVRASPTEFINDSQISVDYSMLDMEPKIWENKEHKRDNSADFYKKVRRLSQKEERKQPPAQMKLLDKLQRLENFNLNVGSEQHLSTKDKVCKVLKKIICEFFYSYFFIINFLIYFCRMEKFPVIYPNSTYLTSMPMGGKIKNRIFRKNS